MLCSVEGSGGLYGLTEGRGERIRDVFRSRGGRIVGGVDAPPLSVPNLSRKHAFWATHSLMQFLARESCRWLPMVSEEFFFAESLTR